MLIAEFLCMRKRRQFHRRLSSYRRLQQTGITALSVITPFLVPLTSRSYYSIMKRSQML
ncbi:MAG: hypothetical protein ACLRL6_06840 [Clostridium sp.]